MARRCRIHQSLPTRLYGEEVQDTSEPADEALWRGGAGYIRACRRGFMARRCRIHQSLPTRLYGEEVQDTSEPADEALWRGGAGYIGILSLRLPPRALRSLARLGFPLGSHTGEKIQASNGALSKNTCHYLR